MDWSEFLLEVVLGLGITALLIKVERIITLLENINRQIQWGSPQIRERRPTPTAQHRGET